MKKDFLWNTIGLSLNAFNSLFFLIVIRYFNGTSEAGVFTYAFSVGALLYVLGCFYTRTYQIANYMNTKNIKDFLSFRIVSCVTCFVLGIVFCLLNGFDLFKSMTIMIVLVFRLFEAFSDCLYGQMQEKGRLYNVGISLSIKSILSLVLLIVLEMITHNLLFSLCGILIANLIIIRLYDRKIFKNVTENQQIKFDTSMFVTIFKESLPIFVFTFLLIYMANSQKYVLTYYVSNDLQTIFGILIMPSTMLSLIGNYLIMPFLTELNLHIKNHDYAMFSKKTHLIMLTMFIIGIFITILTYLFGIPVLSFIYQLDLANYKFDLILIVFASIISAIAIMISNYMVLINKNGVQVIIYAITSIIATLLNVVLISTFKISGAAYAYLISYSILFIAYIVCYEYYIHNMKIKVKNIKSTN